MSDEVVDALKQLVDALSRNRGRIDRAIERARRLEDERATGKPWREIIRIEDRPLIVELIGENLDDLYDAGGRLRRAQAKALHDEGLSMEQIARLFGVSRQRVSALLRGEQQKSQRPAPPV